MVGRRKEKQQQTMKVGRENLLPFPARTCLEWSSSSSLQVQSLVSGVTLMMML